MWFWFALLSAVVSAVSVILNKRALKNINASLVSWSLFAFSIPFLAYPALKDGWPKLNATFFVATILSAVTFAYAKTLSLRSLKNSKLISEIVPLAFFSVLISYILGLIFLGEKIKLLPLLGLGLIIVGGYYLKIKESKEDILKPFKIIFINKDAFYYLLAMLIMPATSLFDKIGLLNSKPVNQTFYLFWGNILTAVLMTGYMTRKDKIWIKDLKTNFKVLFINGAVFTLLSLLYLYALTTGALALVSGIKKLEVLFILLLGWLFFNDRPKKEIWIGSLIMLVGVVLIKLS
ncbi:conserved membrane hypothetical protein [Candidatus Roizmanbacteria bacterium]|nr:conserved membrane hypothetical protein [Candidatus Roizmanbacteria bacterium]